MRSATGAASRLVGLSSWDGALVMAPPPRLTGGGLAMRTMLPMIVACGRVRTSRANAGPPSPRPQPTKPALLGSRHTRLSTAASSSSC
jgi:hypothetical protein